MNYIREAITQQHIGEEAIALRRHLHAHPDLSEQEFPTMELVCEHLEAAGIPYERNVAESGVVGLIKGSFPGPVIALRADMDALPIQEDHPDAPYCSKTAGVMHACGHDAHTAMLMGTAEVLSAMRTQLVVRGFSAMGAGTSYSAMPRRAIRRSTGTFLFSRPPSTGP